MSIAAIIKVVVMGRRINSSERFMDFGNGELGIGNWALDIGHCLWSIVHF
ncbi:hypothetical protein [Microcoleus anatoxicus]